MISTMTMKDLFTIAATLLLFSASSGFVAMGNMLMGNSLGQYLSDLVSFDALTMTQMDYILSMVDNTTSLDRSAVFGTEESKDDLRSYLYAEVSADSLEEYTAEMIASALSLGALYPSEQEDLEGFEGPASKNYVGNGNLAQLARIQTRPTSMTKEPFNIYVGIWGLTKGSREYALVCSTWGFEIIDITEPSKAFRVQGVEMSGGYYWRDAATHTTSTGQVYAYVAAQDASQVKSDLFVFNLSSLSGDIDSPNGVDSNPIQEGTGYVDLGESGYGHTMNVAGGFLFLHVQNQGVGCRVYDLSSPMSPKFLFSKKGQGQECHDSYLYENVNVEGQLKKLWIVSEGSGMKETILDFTGVTPDTASPPPVISTTPVENGIFAHSNTMSADKRFLFQFDENNKGDIHIYDISQVSQPKLINIFQCSEETNSNPLPHNGWIRGGYLYVAYYEAGLVAFDVSNPYEPLEVGRIETYRDPDQTGTNTNKIEGKTNGAWNLYTGLTSGNILVNDMFSGLFVVKADAPYSKPDAPVVSAERNSDGDVTLTWNAVPNTRAYSVERSIGGQNFVVLQQFLPSSTTSFFDNDVRDKNVSYKVKAVNAEGTGVAPTVESLPLTASPTNVPTNQPTPGPTAPPTPNPTLPPSQTPTRQPSQNPTPVPTTTEPTIEVFHRGADGCLKNGETQVDQCWGPVIENERAVNCCAGEIEKTLVCSRPKDPECFLTKSFSEAAAKCDSMGMRLCSTKELETGVCCNMGCNFDARVGWTADVCDGGPSPQPTTPEPTPPPPTTPPTPQPTDITVPSTPYPTFEATAPRG